MRLNAQIKLIHEFTTIKSYLNFSQNCLQTHNRCWTKCNIVKEITLNGHKFDLIQSYSKTFISFQMALRRLHHDCPTRSHDLRFGDSGQTQKVNVKLQRLPLLRFEIWNQFSPWKWNIVRRQNWKRDRWKSIKTKLQLKIHWVLCLMAHSFVHSLRLNLVPVL